MTETVLKTIEILSIGGVVALVGSALSAVLYPAFRRSIEDCYPATRSLVVVGYGLIAPAVAVTVVVLIMHPRFSQMLVPPHCHHGACASHAPAIDTSSTGGLSLIAGGSLLLIGTLFAGIYGVRMAHRRIRMLFTFAQRQGHRDFMIIESDDLFAWCCGIWRTTILVSRGLVRRLSPAQLQLVLAHERAHGRRLDNLRYAALRSVTALWPKPFRRRIGSDLARDAEIACDLEAAVSDGSRADYIAVLEMMMQRHNEMPVGTRSAAFSCRDTGERLEALARENTYHRAVFSGFGILGGLWLAQTAAVTGLTHYLVEWIMNVGLS